MYKAEFEKRGFVAFSFPEEPLSDSRMDPIRKVWQHSPFPPLLILLDQTQWMPEGQCRCIGTCSLAIEALCDAFLRSDDV